MTHSSAESFKRIILAEREMLLTELARFLSPGEKYALVDFPDHSNVGDSAIWLGEISLLHQLSGELPSYVCTHFDYDRHALERSVPEGPIFFNGGGNMGDLWPDNQRFREKILMDFPDRKVIMLPGSIHFNDKRNIEVFARAIEQSRDAHLFVRDERSLAVAQDNLESTVTLSPDAALGLGQLAQPQEPSVRAFALLRTDPEASSVDYRGLRSAEVVIDDWLIEPMINRGSMRNRAIITTIFAGSFSRQQAKARHYNRIAQARVDRGLKQLCQGEIVITDRLHAHILCTLMGKAHVALDNSYGKVSGYWGRWHRDVSNVRFATNVHQIVPALKELGFEDVARDIQGAQ